MLSAQFKCSLDGIYFANIISPGFQARFKLFSSANMLPDHLRGSQRLLQVICTFHTPLAYDTGYKALDFSGPLHRATFPDCGISYLGISNKRLCMTKRDSQLLCNAFLIIERAYHFLEIPMQPVFMRLNYKLDKER